MLRFIVRCTSRFMRTIGVVLLAFFVATTTVHAQPAPLIVLHVDGDDGLASPTGSQPGQTWSNAYLYLADAIDRADFLVNEDPPLAENVQIWVKARDGGAAYYPDECATCDGGNPGASGEQEATFELIEHVALIGGFAGGETQLDQRDWKANETILSGDLDEDDGFTPGALGSAHTFTNTDDNSYHVLIANAVGPTARLDGFTVRSGYADSEFIQDPVANGYGGAIAIASAAAPTATIINCRFERNRSDACGGAIYIQGGGFLELRNCEFVENQGAQGGGVQARAELRLVNCAFIENRAVGTVGGEQGNGAAGSNSTDIRVLNCQFIRNSNVTAGSGGAMGVILNGSATPRFVNCLFDSNSTVAKGGALYIDGIDADEDPARIVNCTFVNNSAGEAGGVYFNTSAAGELVLQNCILWDNTAASGSTLEQQIDGSSGYDPSDDAYHSCIQGLGTPLTNGNINDDPMFKGTGNYHLEVDSPAVDAGDNDFVPCDEFDIDEDGQDCGEEQPTPDLDLAPRIVAVVSQTAVVDMGAFERDPAICTADLDSSCAVDGLDLGILLADWSIPPGSPGCGGASTCPSDLNDDGVIDGIDLGMLLAQWTTNESPPCCEEFGGGESMMAGGAENPYAWDLDSATIAWLATAPWADMWSWWAEMFASSSEIE